MLKILALETNGKVESRNPFIMPKLLYSHADMNVEVSNASAGSDGFSAEYTYVLFKSLPSHEFKFRILPRSVQSITDEWLGLNESIDIDATSLKNLLAIRTNNADLMKVLLDHQIQLDLLTWASQNTNRLSDIRTYDDKLIYAITGMPRDHHEFKLLLNSAQKFVDKVRHIISE